MFHWEKIDYLVSFAKSQSVTGSVDSETEMISWADKLLAFRSLP